MGCIPASNSYNRFYFPRELTACCEATKLMSNKIKAAILIPSAAVLIFALVGGLDAVGAASNDGAYRQMMVYSEVLSRVHSEYVEEPNIPAVTDGAPTIWLSLVIWK